MAFNIDQFTGEMNRNKVAYENAYEVSIFRQGKTSGIERNLMFRVPSVDLPGRSVSFVEYFTYGSPQKVGTTANYQEISMTILSSEDFAEREYFLNWQSQIVGAHHTEGNSNPRRNNFDIGYYDNYIGQVEIGQFSVDGRETHRTKLLEVFPNNVGQISNSWASKDLVTFPVTFVFRYFETIDTHQQLDAGALDEFNIGEFAKNINGIPGDGLSGLTDGLSIEGFRKNLNIPSDIPMLPNFSNLNDLANIDSLKEGITSRVRQHVDIDGFTSKIGEFKSMKAGIQSLDLGSQLQSAGETAKSKLGKFVTNKFGI